MRPDAIHWEGSEAMKTMSSQTERKVVTSRFPVLTNSASVSCRWSQIWEVLLRLVEDFNGGRCRGPHRIEIGHKDVEDDELHRELSISALKVLLHIGNLPKAWMLADRLAW